MLKIIIATLSIVPSIACGAYRCVDEKGSTHFEETPPAACGNVPIVEVSRSGAIVRTISPSRPPDPPKPAADARKTDAQGERAALDQKRRDRALLDSYTSETEVDAARDRNLDLIRGRMSASQLRLRQVTQRESDLDRAVQSYKGRAGGAPPRVVQDLQTVREEKRSIEASVEKLARDLEHTRRQFDADKARWAELHVKH